MENKYFGKYRAFVVDINDPEKRGRIKVHCPKVLGDYISAWCEPCIPFAYEKGGDFHIPRLNDFVWVEFEEGSPDRPIWVGSLWTIENSSCSEYNTDKRVIEFLGGRIEMTSSDITLSIGSARINLNVGGNIDLN